METIRPLLLTQSDTGGAGTATRRIHEGLRHIDVPSRLLVRDHSTDTVAVEGPNTKPRKMSALLRPYLDKIPLSLFDPSPEFSLSWVPDRISSRIQRLDPDVIHLNWIANGYMSPSTIAELDRPVIWRLPDMWPMTGGCHYTKNCERYTASCGSCPQLGSSIEYDPSRVMLSRKRRSVEQANLTVVATTSWLAERARESTIFADCPVEVIPNGLDTSLFSPHDKNVGRELFELPTDRPLILFGATGPLSNPRKGYSLLESAIESLPVDETRSPELVIFGASNSDSRPEFDLPTHYTGYLHDEESLALLYAAADVMVVPSRYEAFGQTATEAMACGTPVVAFEATGPADTIVHERTGYLAEPYDAQDLSIGITWILENEERRRDLSENARRRAEENYDIVDIAKQYRDLYRQIT